MTQPSLDIIEIYKVPFKGKDYAAVRVKHNGDTYSIGLSGDLGNLALQYLDGQCPLGIFIDCLADNPELFGSWKSSKEMVPQIVAAFHRAYPDPLWQFIEDDKQVVS